MKYLYVVLVVFLIASCVSKQEVPKEWVFKEAVKFKGVNPIGITESGGKLWLSDGDHNRLVQIDLQGKILKTIDSLDRPMHIVGSDGALYIPQYGKDAIEIVDSKGRYMMQLPDSLDAPAGISVVGKEKAIADFYNNRILYNDGKDWISFGKEGKAQGEFYYPTDVQVTATEIWVADAYNNRVQVFDKSGNFVKMMGQDQKMNAATGIYVAENEVFVTDFENDRVLVFDKSGNLRQELKKEIKKPTDILVVDNLLYIINYRSGELLSFSLEPQKAKS